MKRRTFIKATAAGTIGAGVIPGLFPVNHLLASEDYPQAVWVENGEPEALLNAAMQELGGIKRFIKKGDVVVIKPNIGWDRQPELAATTNPDLVAALVKQCKQAGADEVKIFDRTCNNPRRCYNSSQIQEKASAAGADIAQVRRNRYKTIPIDGELIDEWPIYEDYLNADKVINVPIAKHHSLSRVTLGLKNLMGVMGGNRGAIHNQFDVKLADINRNILPTLTIIDAYRILTDNGPVGGNPNDVELRKTLIASPCTVSADFLALDLFGHRLQEVGHIRTAQQRGLAKYDLNKLNVKRIKLG